MVFPFSRCACGPGREKKTADYDSDDDRYENSAKTSKTAVADRCPPSSAPVSGADGNASLTCTGTNLP
jgi:hypothetical protein